MTRSAIFETTWPLFALVGLIAAVAAFDPGAAGQILRAALALAL